jgi:hypothetical protein
LRVSHPRDFSPDDDYDINLADTTNKDTFDIGLLRQTRPMTLHASCRQPMVAMFHVK